MPVDEILAHLPVSAEATVADIGAGTGYFAIPLARRVQRVLAVDVQPRMLELLRNKLLQPGSPRNLELVEGSAASTSLASARCDLVFLANVWHEIDNSDDVLAEMRRIFETRGQSGDSRLASRC